MTKDAVEILKFLRPEGGWAITGNEYEGIEFVNCEPFTEKEFNDAFGKYEKAKAKEETDKAKAKEELLNRLGITVEEAKLLLS